MGGGPFIKNGEQRVGEGVAHGEEWTMDFGSEVAIGEDVILIGDRDVHHGEGKVFTLYKDGEEWRTGSPLNYNYIKSYDLQ